MGLRRPVVLAAIAGGLAICAVVAGVFLFGSGGGSATPQWRLAAVERGDVISAVAASGTLNAVITVEISSQLSGQIKELLADFNTPVTKGQVLARLDPATFEARLRQADAELETARANVILQSAAIERARADLSTAESAVQVATAQTGRAQATLTDATREQVRRRDLVNQGVGSRRDAEKAETEFQTGTAGVQGAEAQLAQSRSALLAARAAVSMSEAQLRTAQATVKQREAALMSAQVDLDRTEIRAPIDGIVLNRVVDLGQTVAASLQSPTLFAIAEDLKSMQVEVSVDEADIGRIEPGQRTLFTVDALPNREFTGTVGQIRKAPKTVQNVVTYVVVVDTRNDDLKLLPGLTANARIIIDERKNVLRLPNTAFRFKPAGADPAQPAASGGGESSGGGPAATFDPMQATERLTQVLKLNDEQKKQVQAIFAEGGQRGRALRQQGLTGTELQQAVAAMRENSSNQIRAILNAEQRAGYEKVQAAMRNQRANAASTRNERVWVVGPDGKPQAVAVRIGIGDGTYSELQGGEIKEGQKLIVGTAAAKPAAGGGSGLRLGL
ncbi:MAG: putative Efflux transporter, family, subunit [Alphaproteobacteria bacterium]|nr:putative Efflux transporter, family, subunit [Alphaproteobacteria bacterium]